MASEGGLPAFPGVTTVGAVGAVGADGLVSLDSADCAPAIEETKSMHVRMNGFIGIRDDESGFKVCQYNKVVCWCE